MKSKVAIVTSYSEDCGIAYHSVRIIALFKQVLGQEIDVIRLPVSDLRGNSHWQRRASLRFIKEACARISEYDHVILQLEPGLYGTHNPLIYKRLRMLAKAVRRGMIIVHSYGHDQVGSATWVEAFSELLARRPSALLSKLKSPFGKRHANSFWESVRKGQFGILALNRRDNHILRGLFKLKTTAYFPLCYFTDSEIIDIRAASRSEFCLRYNLPEDKKLIGVFGFFGPYKGHLTALKALEHLPEDHHAVIVGGEHPHSLPVDKAMSKYMQQMLSFSTYKFDEDTNDLQKINGKSAANDWAALFKDDEFYHFLPRSSLCDRVHYIGSVTDEEMPRIYAAIDCAVHPYLNTRAQQSGSGPATFAVEIGPPSLFSNAAVFREMRYFFPFMETFGVGNYLELARKIETIAQWRTPEAARMEARAKYNPATMCQTYCKLMGRETPG